MVNKIDKTLGGGLFKYYTDSNCCYIIDIHAGSIDSDLWFIDLFKEYGTPDKREVFSILKTLADLSIEYANNNGIKKVLAVIDANDDKEREKKTKVFTRYINDDWEFKVLSNPDFKISGKRNHGLINTSCIFMTKKEIDNSKYCPKCGVKDNNYKFCPECGFKIKED